ncbi:MAG: hypothetical protein HRU18_01655 [Pseudoalteromonas sp.]|uniref:hypothetical protein n=1 Tax=Pseudoalteromonas sp. TaxID=53249 RepID=UPI001DD072EB|nr:hypothetical protein [Pseudoalteromonas sp.]NRA76887.1 hypothetical protein [Pseudoalteromonas sp.]
MINVDQIEKKPRSVEKVASDPAGVADHGVAYPKEVNGIVEYFFRDSAGTITQITENGSLRLPTSPALAPVGGAKGSSLAKLSNTDYAFGWVKQNVLMNDFYFVLPKAVSIDARVTALGTVAGLSLFSADNDPNPDDEFGLNPATLIIKPTGLTGVIMTELDLMELDEAGAIANQGWKPLTSFPEWKSNKAMDRGAIMDFNNVLDQARDVLVRVRFFTPVMP